MSKKLTKTEILYLQPVCAICGFYQGRLDGKWTADMDKAEEILDRKRREIREEVGQFDARSEANIATLIPPAQKLARQFMKIAAGFPFTVKIISGSRTYAEQDALYAIGRTIQKTRKKVTNAKGGHSNHNFGLAWDVGIFEKSGRYMDGKKKGDDAAYEDLAKLVKPNLANLEWGGEWPSFVDPPHYQLATGGKSTAEVRTLFESGKPMFA